MEPGAESSIDQRYGVLRRNILRNACEEPGRYDQQEQADSQVKAGKDLLRKGTLQTHQPQPRSGKRSVAHGVSRGYDVEANERAAERRNSKHIKGVPPLPGLVYFGVIVPMAHAMDFRSFAAPRLISARFIDAIDR
jgi:hypothetical protein